MLRLTKPGKKKYVSLGISVKEKNQELHEEKGRADHELDESAIFSKQLINQSFKLIHCSQIGIFVPTWEH